MKRSCPGKVCIDGEGFETRPCPGCGRSKRKVITPNGLEVVLPADAAEAYRLLMQAVRGEGEAEG